MSIRFFFTILSPLFILFSCGREGSNSLDLEKLPYEIQKVDSLKIDRADGGSWKNQMSYIKSKEGVPHLINYSFSTYERGNFIEFYNLEERGRTERIDLSGITKGKISDFAVKSLDSVFVHAFLPERILLIDSNSTVLDTVCMEEDERGCPYSSNIIQPMNVDDQGLYLRNTDYPEHGTEDFYQNVGSVYSVLELSEDYGERFRFGSYPTVYNGFSSSKSSTAEYWVSHLHAMGRHFVNFPYSDSIGVYDEKGRFVENIYAGHPKVDLKEMHALLRKPEGRDINRKRAKRGFYPYLKGAPDSFIYRMAFDSLDGFLVVLNEELDIVAAKEFEEEYYNEQNYKMGRLLPTENGFMLPKEEFKKDSVTLYEFELREAE